MTDLLSKENENDFYQSPVKIIPFLVFEVGCAFLMSFYFRQLIGNVNPPTNGLFLFLTGAGLFVIFSFLNAFFVSGFLWSNLAAGLSALASLAVFYDYFSTTFIVFGILISLIFIWGINSLRSEMESSLKIRFFRLTKVFLPKIGLGVAILLSLFSYFLFSSRGGFPISFENLQFLLKPNEKPIGFLVKDFSFQKPFQAVLADLLGRRSVVKIPNFETLSASAQKIIIESAIGQELAGLNKFLGFEINTQDSVERVIYDSLLAKFNQFDEKAKKWIIIGIFAVLFLVIRALFIPLNLLLSILAFLIYLFLLAFDYASIKTESRSKEV
ncbi:MAG: hypothetical protein AAB404_00920, partial [Patescibacteria group bacterium]